MGPRKEKRDVRIRERWPPVQLPRKQFGFQGMVQLFYKPHLKALFMFLKDNGASVFGVSRNYLGQLSDHVNHPIKTITFNLFLSAQLSYILFRS